MQTQLQCLSCILVGLMIGWGSICCSGSHTYSTLSLPLNTSEPQKIDWQAMASEKVSPLLITPAMYQNNLPSGLKFTPDGKYLLTLDNGLSLKLWEVESANVVQIYTGCPEWMLDIDVSPDGNYIAAISPNRLYVWHTVSGQMIIHGHAFSEHIVPFEHPTAHGIGYCSQFLRGGDIIRFQFAPDSQSIIVAREKGEMIQLNLESREVIQHMYIEFDIRFIALRSHANSLIVVTNGTEKGELVFWDLETGSKQTQLKTKYAHLEINTIAISPDGNYLAVGGGKRGQRSQRIEIWDLNKNAFLFSLDDLLMVLSTVSHILFSKDNQYLIARDACYGETLLCNWKNGYRLDSLAHKVTSGFSPIAFSPDSSYIAYHAYQEHATYFMKTTPPDSQDLLESATPFIRSIAQETTEKDTYAAKEPYIEPYYVQNLQILPPNHPQSDIQVTDSASESNNNPTADGTENPTEIIAQEAMNVTFYPEIDKVPVVKSSFPLQVTLQWSGSTPIQSFNLQVEDAVLKPVSDMYIFQTEFGYQYSAMFEMIAGSMSGTENVKILAQTESGIIESADYSMTFDWQWIHLDEITTFTNNMVESEPEFPFPLIINVGAGVTRSNIKFTDATNSKAFGLPLGVGISLGFGPPEIPAVVDVDVVFDYDFYRSQNLGTYRGFRLGGGVGFLLAGSFLFGVVNMQEMGIHGSSKGFFFEYDILKTGIASLFSLGMETSFIFHPYPYYRFESMQNGIKTHSFGLKLNLTFFPPDASFFD